ncbi:MULTISPECIES: helix-turn-helix transcriptional regulator [Thalassospira]|jgi:predicted DNA-binding transcriptional regulator YafY|uniref:DeoR family transcriptional regulator n=3 Tax=Thalassospira TaxID=168934 RepID=A0A853KWR8_9PROT|nr:MULTISPECIES: YafY family protein [Thalassospira]KXJ55194.1 MAG: DNA-binding transcriptional regulator [Thalassospira sp. Nap_22]OAZ12282.1 DeoR family transcriptional regulator [Thalassospira profundimaris]AXO14237.1 YafY family transcriptional regulator [Thalassospira indica]EKF06637.1 regulatory protein DeoR [Thalassospira profundimaris WP0211]KZC97504.1 DNA-binding transcriptional regulator [Thalassospira sp. MCCC 1A02898]|tara:strand:+ start:1556 stop:2260 length:705 start_codon:yes stop_codon:yes gene_type:complete
MRRADRLFRLVQILRRRKLCRACDLAEELEVSERTIYRDIRDLAASGVPVEGEAGVGYILRDGYDLPPLMFDADEIEALVVAARMVQSWTDPQMARAAGDALTKIEAVLPEKIRGLVGGVPIAIAEIAQEPIAISMPDLRRAIRERFLIDIDYTDAKGDNTRRRVWPLGMLFFGSTWLLASWCELREAFRVFRADRIAHMEISTSRFRPVPGRSLRDYLISEGVEGEILNGIGR